MYNALKSEWNKLPSLAANQHFPKFRYFLERGGKVALIYIEENADLVETVLGGPDEVQALKTAIAKRNTAYENQVYFVREARRLESQIKAVLRTRYNALQGHCEQQSLPWKELTPETLLPTTRRAVETGEWGLAKSAAEAADGDSAPTVGTEGAEQPDDENPAPGAEGPAEGSKVEAAAEGEEAPATETEAETEASIQAAEDETPKAEKSAEDELRVKIASLHKEGQNKAEIWAEVKPATEAVGWSRTAVWAYVDELAE